MSSLDKDTLELQASDPGDGDDGVYSQHNSHSGVYETRYQKSLRHYLTREALPKESAYRNLNSIVDGSGMRPTLDDLHNNTYQEQARSTTDLETSEPQIRGKVIKFGWLEGVLMRCLLNIWGVMLFLRMTWVTGQAGIVQGALLIILANVVTVITTISMSAVATNGQIKAGQGAAIIILANLITTISALSMSAVATNGHVPAGGIYYMISRSLGPEFGGSIGLMFTVANSIAASTYIIGFVNSVQDMCLNYFGLSEIIPGAGGGLNDVRVLGTITLILVLALAIVGMDWVTRVQMALLFVLIGSQIDFLIGIFMGPSDTLQESQGFLGFDRNIFRVNLKADYRYFAGVNSFFTVFGVFFPAVTGIVAGANLSGDLKDPGTAIPKGTLLAIIITFITYLIYPVMVGASVVRDALGNETAYLLTKDEYPDPTQNPVFNLETVNGSCPVDDNGQSTCKYGLQNSFQVMELVSAWGPLIYIGCYAATLSSAIASLVGAPRVLQALAKDRLYPGLHIFEVGHGANNDPIRGYILVFVISLLCIMIGDLNAVSSLLTNFFLASYSLINFSCFHASLIKSPGWRPSFKFYNLWVSMVGGVVCVAIMFLIDTVTAFITVVITIFLYMYVSYRKPNVNWGSSTQAQTYVSALKSTLELINVEEHVKNYRPQILVLSGQPSSRPSLVDFAHFLTKNISFLSCANIMKGTITQKSRNKLTKSSYDWFQKHKIKSFYNLTQAEEFDQGAKTLFQLVGLGKLRPNIVLMGFKNNWRTCDRKELLEYFNTLHEAFDMYLGLAILRVQEGFDFSQLLEDDDTVPNGTDVPATTPIADAQSPKNTSQIHQDNASNSSTPPGSPATERVTDVAEKMKRRSSMASLFKGVGGVDLPKEVLNNITRFHRKQKKGFIDVWWLYDDGGLTLLLPYILSLRSQWHGCKLRVFVMANRKDEIDTEIRSMANLLAKFRIPYQDMTVIPDLAKRAGETPRKFFEEIIHDFREKNSEETGNNQDAQTIIMESEIVAHREKINRHNRLREMLLENSSESSLIVMTLPMPRKNSVSAPLYMTWLECLTKDMPPFLLVRGNQTSVLTFYS